MKVRLTVRRLKAMEEALSSRLAGENDIDGDPDAPTHADYEAAWEWVIQQMNKRESTT